MTAQCPVCARIIGTRPDGRLVEHDTLTGRGWCHGSSAAPALADAKPEPMPAWAMALEQRLMDRLDDLARGYRLAPERNVARAPKDAGHAAER